MTEIGHSAATTAMAKGSFYSIHGYLALIINIFQIITIPFWLE